MKKKMLSICFLTFSLAGCSGLSKIDYWNLYHRAGWQLPEKVIESLNIRPGDQVADIGAGSGYFTFFLAQAVGPSGKVYAVEIDREAITVLEERVEELRYRNIVVIRGSSQDPRLPDGTIDLVFLCNTYHHIEGRVDYFSRLRADLKPEGRLAVVDMKDDLTGVLGLFASAGHSTPRALLLDEIGQAGYRHGSSLEFLPVQTFEVFFSP